VTAVPRPTKTPSPTATIAPTAQPTEAPTEAPTAEPAVTIRPVDPTPTPGRAVNDGFAMGADGAMRYYKNGAVDETMNGIVEHEGIKYFMVRGKCSVETTGLLQNPTTGKYYYVEKGIVLSEKVETRYVSHPKGSEVALRSSPNAASDAITLITSGTEVQRVMTSGEWSMISYRNYFGWIESGYCTDGTTPPVTPPPTAAPTNQPTAIPVGDPIYIVSTNKKNLNVRSGPGTEYEVIGGLLKGTEVRVTEIRNGWARIPFGEGFGWATMNYLKPKG